VLKVNIIPGGSSSFDIKISIFLSSSKASIERKREKVYIALK